MTIWLTDKMAHFGMGLLAAMLTTAGAYQAGLGRWVVIALGLVIPIMVGLAKELYDFVVREGEISLVDITYTFAGGFACTGLTATVWLP